MIQRLMRRDVLVLMLVLVVVAGTGLWSKWDITKKRAALEARSVSLKSQLVPPEEAPNSDVLVEIESGKSFGFFGRDWGVIRFYVRSAGDTAMDSFIGVEHFHEYNNGDWEEIDTARIDLPTHIYEGYEAFERAGLEVDANAYERYNR